MTWLVNLMKDYLDTLVNEFREKYKPLADRQRGYEERAQAVLKRYAELAGADEPPELPSFMWQSLLSLPVLSDFVGEGRSYTTGFKKPLDDASELLRDEHARILESEERI